MSDYLAVQAAKDLGHKAYLSSIIGKNQDQVIEVFRKLGYIHWLPARLHLDGSYATFYKIHSEALLAISSRNNIDCIFPSSGVNGGYMPVVSKVAATASRPWISREQAYLFSRKDAYLETLRKNGIRTPYIYEVVEFGKNPENLSRISYPCICKPSQGYGSIGVYVAQDENSLRHFFSTTPVVKGVPREKTYFYDRSSSGYHYYAYRSLGGSYLIEEFLGGKTLSVSGFFYKGEFVLDLIYEIENSPLPYRSEVGYSWPALNDEDEECRIQYLCQSICSILDFPDGPVMLDLIYTTGGELVVIDLAPRMSSSGCEMSYWAKYNKNTYCENLVRIIAGESPILESHKGMRPVYSRSFDFPKALVKKITYPSQLADYVLDKDFRLKDGDRVYEMRFDAQVKDRGTITTTGANLSEARKNWQQVQSQVHIDLKM